MVDQSSWKLDIKMQKGQAFNRHPKLVDRSRNGLARVDSINGSCSHDHLGPLSNSDRVVLGLKRKGSHFSVKWSLFHDNWVRTRVARREIVEPPFSGCREPTEITGFCAFYTPTSKSDNTVIFFAKS